ncbi:Ig-like domain-containing protein [Candidatus Marinarcus aquaticus]|uniref:VWFA domain-containing protein n=1 Tax=Candidatus Marinarcus aquaticus TaxID=2044504 RepID=A0A4Q0XQM5_9BACT|nr:Ig-like domain-containing protein [Candidatus Marinarcus aquaticus]RXJ54597.1 hypothetical protein CRV04_11215 [Candidatus Marinarcus aquaticus]
MAESIAKVQSLLGKFYAQDESGNVRVLKVGDTIYQGEKVYGDAANNSSDKLQIVSDTQETFDITGSDSLVFDTSTNEATFGNEEVAFNPNSAWMPTADNATVPEGETVTDAQGDITEEETAAGNEAASSSDVGVFNFENRDGDSVNIQSDLRESVFSNNSDSLVSNNGDGLNSNPSSNLLLNGTPTPDDVNDVPVAVDDSFTLDEDASYTGTVATNDTLSGDGGNTFAVSGNPAHGTVTMNADGTFTYTPAADYNGADSFTYTITDADGDTSTATVNLTVSSVNDVPVAVTDSINVSEEGLTNGIGDTNGTPTDTTNSNSVVGQLTIHNPDNDALTITLNAPTDSLSSGNETIVWSGNNTHELIGKVGDTEVIKIAIADDGSYSVTLLDPVDHPMNDVEDILSFNVGVNISDGESSSSSTITVNIEDDMPTVETSTTVWTEATSIPDIFTGQVSFAGSSANQSRFVFANGAVLVTGKGFTSDTDLTLIDADLNQSSGGLGVASDESPYHNLANEVDFRKTADGEEGSEELIIKLADGKISYGATITFDYMFGGEEEVGEALFYRDGVLISTQRFTSDAQSGDYAKNFEVTDGGFDTIVIRALDNGNGYHDGDNSDFVVSGVEFLGSSQENPISYAEGTIDYEFGADGAGSIVLTSLQNSVRLADGTEPEITISDNTIIAKDADGHLVFQIQFTPSTGQWEFYQYQKFTIGDGSSQTLGFNFRVTDADGDAVNGTVSVGITNHGVEIEGIGAAQGDLTVDEANLDDGTQPNESDLTQSGTFTLNAMDGISEIQIGSETFTYEELVNAASNNISIETDHGTLVITGYSGSETSGTVSYSYTLKDSVDNDTQNGATSDEYVDQIDVNVTDKDGDSSSASININIQDDAPVASDTTVSVDAMQETVFNANVMLTLDYSGSMSSTALSEQKDAAKKLLDQYQKSLNEADRGDVKVMVIKFATGAATHEKVWLTIAEAKAYIDQGKPYGIDSGTNYDDALKTLIENYSSSGKVTAEGTINNSYFMTDGQPTQSNYTSSNDGSKTEDSKGDGIGIGEHSNNPYYAQGTDANSTTYVGTNGEVGQGNWQAFLEEHDIVSYAIGMGNNVQSSGLEPIAYDGTSEQQNHDKLLQPQVDFNKLGDLLVSTTPEAQPVTSTLSAELGADGGYVSSITISGETYTFDGTTITNPNGTTANGHTLCVTTEFGTFEINLETGVYTYTPVEALAQVEQETIGFTVTDNDGDTSSATLTIDLSALVPDVPTVVEDAHDTVITNENGASSIQAEASLGVVVGKDSAGSTVTVTNANGDSLVGDTVTVKVTDANGSEHEINATYNDVQLKYISDGSGGLIAVTDDATQTHVFTVEGDASAGTYKVTMIHALDPVYSVPSILEDQTTQISLNSNGGSNSGINVTLNSNGGAVNQYGNSIGINDYDVGSAKYEIEGYEVLSMNFNALTGVSVSKVSVNFNDFGYHDDAIVKVYYTDNTYDTYEVHGDYNDRDGIDIEIPEGKTLSRIDFGAEDYYDDYSVNSTITVVYDKQSTIPVDNPEQTLEFGAVVTDGNGDQSEVVTFDVTVDSDHVLQGDVSDSIIGGDGDDTFKLLNGQDINFDGLDAHIKNIETIDLSAEGKNEIKNLSLDDVIDMTDSDNEIKISGTSEDEVHLTNEWSTNNVVDADGYIEYIGTSDDETVKVKIHQDIHTDIQ